MSKKKPKEQTTLVSIVHDTISKTYLLVQRPKTGLLASFWEFPSVDIEQDTVSYAKHKEIMNRYLSHTLNLDFLSRPAQNVLGSETQLLDRYYVNDTKHLFSHIQQKLTVEAILISLPNTTKPEDNTGKTHTKIQWVTEKDFETIATSKGMKKCLALFKQTNSSKVKKRPTKKQKQMTLDSMLQNNSNDSKQ